MITILDAYTDEPAGLGVPPYLGVWPRYVAGKYKADFYLTIDDLRLAKNFGGRKPLIKLEDKTNIKVKNFSKNLHNVDEILRKSKAVIVIAGSHTPGKYMGAVPGTLKEILELLKEFKGKKALAGPIASEFGSSVSGGKFLGSKGLDNIRKHFDDILDISCDSKIAVEGAKRIGDQVFQPFIAEIETSRGCIKGKPCSFCVDGLKDKLEFREQKDIIAEVKVLRKFTSFFRLGKQTCFYSYKNGNVNEIEKLLKGISDLKPEVLHIDNVNPAMVTEDITKLIVKYCTSGNVAALGVESFDEKVIKANDLSNSPEVVFKAIRIINKYGAEVGENGLPKFLPGINLLYGLIDEDKKTFDINFEYLKKILDSGLLIRRINIRQVVPYLGTKLQKEVGVKFLKKNKKYHWKANNKIRQDIDLPMLKKIVPIGTVLKDVFMEMWWGSKSFGRQIGSYPLIVGVNERLALHKFVDIKVVGHMLRSVVGEKI